MSKPRDWSAREKVARAQLERAKRLIEQAGSHGVSADRSHGSTWKRRTKRKHDA